MSEPCDCPACQAMDPDEREGRLAIQMLRPVMDALDALNEACEAQQMTFAPTAKRIARAIGDREADAREQERRAAWLWFGELLEAHQLKGQPVWDEFMTAKRDLAERGWR